MKSIKEKQLLVNFAKALGQDVDPRIVAEVDSFNKIREDAIKSIKSDSAKNIDEAFNIEYPKPPTVDEVLSVITEEVKDELVQTNEETIPNTAEPATEQSLADQAAKFISEAPKTSFQQPTPALPQLDLNALARKIQNLETWLGKVSLEGPGSGEVRLRFLDDVDRNAIADDKYLRYESSTGKFTFDAGHKNNFHGSWQSNVTQRMSASNVASVVTYNAIDFQSKFRLESNSRIVSEEPGRYNLQYSIQLENSGAATESVNIWLVQNGVAVPRTNSKFDVLGKHAGANGAIIAAINYFYETTVANEYVELGWWATDPDTFLSTIPPVAAVPGLNPAIPETPTAIVTVSPVKVDSY